MIRLRPDVRVLLTALAILVIGGIVLTLMAPPPPAPPLSVRNQRANGAMLLRDWLDELGFQTREMLTEPMRLDTIDVLFVLDPALTYDASEVALIADWVRRGNTLIVAGEPFFVNDLLRPFRVSARYLFYRAEEDQILSPTSPILQTPPFDRVRAEPQIAIGDIEVRKREDVAVHLAVSTQPVLVSFREGRGRVWVSGAFRPFTNRGLGTDGASARLLLNLLAGIPRGATIGFDEVRHGFTEQPATLAAWLTQTPPGWGVMIGAALTGVYLGLRGRRFGRAVPLPDSALRREYVEYIQAIANLLRRSGQRAEMLRHFDGQLRRRLSERYGVEPHLSADDLAKAVAARDPAQDAAALRDVLVRLARKSVSEAELVRIAADVDGLIERMR